MKAMEYVVEAYKDGRWWIFEIPALTAPAPDRGTGRIVATGQARKVDDITAEARSLAALWTQTEESNISIRLVFRMPADIEKALAQAETLDKKGRYALEKAASLRREVVHELRTGQGMSQTESAHVLGISRQRVQQLEMQRS